MSGHWHCLNRPLSGSHLEVKVDTVYSLLSMLNHQNKAEMIERLHQMSNSLETCHELRQYGCLPLLVQLIHPVDDYDCVPEKPQEDHQVREKATEALRNVVKANDDKREMRVLRLLEEIRFFSELLRTASWTKDEEESKEPQQHPGPAISSLMKFSFDEKHRQAICDLGGLQAIAELLHNDCEYHGNTVNTQCVTIRRYASMALTNLTFGDERNKSLLCSMRYFMKALVKQLHSPSEELRQVTASVLRNLSWRADKTSKQILRDVGVVITLMKAALEATKESTLKSILSALWNLSAHSVANKSDICAVDGALQFLVTTLTYKSVSNTLAIIENGGGILRNVSSHVAVNEEYRVILRETNCLPILLEQLKSPSLTVVSNACGTLWNLSARCPQDQKTLWELGAVGMLKNLVNSKHKMISIGSKAALKNLLSADIPGFSPNLSEGNTPNSESDSVPSLPARKLKAFKAELDENLAETCDNIESPKCSPTHNLASTPMGHHSVGRANANQYLPYRMYTSFSGNACTGFISRSSSRDSIGSTHSEPYNMYRLHNYKYATRPHSYNPNFGATYWAHPVHTHDSVASKRYTPLSSNNDTSPVDIVSKAFEFCENELSDPSSSSSIESNSDIMNSKRNSREDSTLNSGGETPDLLTDLMPTRRNHYASTDRSSPSTQPKSLVFGGLEHERRDRPFTCEKISEDDSERIETGTIEAEEDVSSNKTDVLNGYDLSTANYEETVAELETKRDVEKPVDNREENAKDEETESSNTEAAKELDSHPSTMSEGDKLLDEIATKNAFAFPPQIPENINSEALNLLNSIASDMTGSSCLSDLESIKPPSLMDELSVSLTSSSCMTDSVSNKKPRMRMKAHKSRRIPVAKKGFSSKAPRSISSNEIFIAYTNPPSLMEEVSGLSSSCGSLNSIPSEVYDPPVECMKKLKDEAAAIVQHYTKEINQLTASYNSTSCDSDVLEKIKPPKIFRETKSNNDSTYVPSQGCDLSDTDDFDDLPKDSHDNSTLVPDDTSVDVSSLPLSTTEQLSSASYTLDNDTSRPSSETENCQDFSMEENAKNNAQLQGKTGKSEDDSDSRSKSSELFLDNENASLISTSDDDSKATYTCSPKKARIIKPVNRNICRKDEPMARKVTVNNMKKQFSPQHTITPPSSPSVKSTRTSALRAARSKSAEYPAEVKNATSQCPTKANTFERKNNNSGPKCYHNQTFVIRRKSNSTVSPADRSNGNVCRSTDKQNNLRMVPEKDLRQLHTAKMNEKNNNMTSETSGTPKKREVQSKIASLWKRNKAKDNSSKEPVKPSKILSGSSITRSSTYEKLPNSADEATKIEKTPKTTSLSKVRPSEPIFSSDTTRKFAFSRNYAEKDKSAKVNNTTIYKKNYVVTAV